jgi:hypothetical protein
MKTNHRFTPHLLSSGVRMIQNYDNLSNYDLIKGTGEPEAQIFLLELAKYCMIPQITTDKNKLKKNLLNPCHSWLNSLY